MVYRQKWPTLDNNTSSVGCQNIDSTRAVILYRQNENKNMYIDETHQSVVVVGITEWLSCSQNLTLFDVVHLSTRK